MASNDDLLAAIVRHQVDILRFSKGEAEAVLRILDQADKDLVAQIAARTNQGLSNFGTARLEALLQTVREKRAKAFQRVKQHLKGTTSGLAANEIKFEADVMQGSLDFDLNMADVPDAKLKAVVNSPIRGLELDGWLDNLNKADTDRLQGIINLGVIEGQTPQQLIAAASAALLTTRRNAEALTRTAINHVSNKARESVWDANADIIDGLRWTATLDGRTSPICQSRDGEVAPVGDNPLPAGADPLNPPGARPPAHFNCRSVMVPIIDGETAIGDRPFIRDKRRPKQRLADFRKQARLKAGDAWKTMSTTQRNAAIAAERKAWAAANVGRVPAKTTYEQWLRKQPRQFQNEVLGLERGKLFRQGASLDKFIDKSGKTLNLKQLAAASAENALAVKQTGLGLKAKSLILQGLSNQQVLNKIKAEFPDANTTLASISSYRSVMKKAGQLDIQKVTGAGKTLQQQGLDTMFTVKQITDGLPEGIKSAVGNTWFQIVDDLSGPTIAHYKPGLGVQISAKKLSQLSPSQARMVVTHELGHMLHKQYPKLNLGKLSDFKLIAKETWTDIDFKNYSYYMAHIDEVHAEIYAHALTPNAAMTSQGLVNKNFKLAFQDIIDEAADNLKVEFPIAPPVSSGVPIPGSGLVAGNPQTMGVTGYVKELLKQNMNADDILVAVKAEFPNAKTTKASIASTKSVMKKKGQLPSPASKSTIHATQTTAKPVPIPKDVKPKILTAKDAAADLNYLQDDGLVKAHLVQFVSGQKNAAKKTLLKLLQSGKTGPNSSLAAQISELFPKAGMKASNVASFKTQWKKKGLWGKDSIADLGLPEPTLKLSQMGSHSKSGLIKAEQMFANGATHQQVEQFFAKHFGTWDPIKGKDILYLAEYNAKLGKFSGSKAATAVSKAKKTTPNSNIDMTPIRPATGPNDSWPPPPRFSEQQQKVAFRRYSDRPVSNASNTSVNQALKAQGKEPLTDVEYSVIRAYTGSFYGQINRDLRGGKFSDNLDLQAVVDAGQSGLRKMYGSNFRFEGWVNRGTTLNTNDFELFQKMYVKGAVIEEHGFLSTSKGSGFGGRIRFKIMSKTGVEVRTLSNHPGENEVLFMPGVKFRIDNVVVDNAKRTTTVTMTEIFP